ncbi:MAG TPA: 30S ribosomal protein THX [Flavobacteriales bacterium]|jgi:ribosomal small subunit protein bTHX|nr:30S ribosomal protein THX [Flavobacteriales bacterium]|tara:strand:+ start:8368 stop:8583 length:216 start_codon:yes stop_codon:yes gene_type:complete
MGKGDKKSKKGKIRMGSFGKVRPRKKAKITFVAKKVEKKEVEKTETKKKTTKKKAAVKKKTATKKATKKKA